MSNPYSYWLRFASSGCPSVYQPGSTAPEEAGLVKMAAPATTVCDLSPVAVVYVSFTLNGSGELLEQGKGGDESNFREAASLAQPGEKQQ